MRTSFTKMAGRSLIEVMIALTLGMVILLAISSLFMTNKQTYRTSDDKTRLDEEGYLALNLLSFHVRMAGYGSLMNATPKFSSAMADPLHPELKVLPTAAVNTNMAANGVTLNAIRGCVGGFTDTATVVTGIACVGGVTSDALLVRYAVDAINANVTAAGAPTDCLGAAVTVTPASASIPAFFAVENRFFVQNNPITNVPELYCRGNGGTVPGANLVNAAQPITENVERMSITYGLSTIGGQSANRFVPANLVTNWENVVSARICLVVRSANNGLATKAQSYRDCNDTLVLSPDLRLRGVFSTTVALRNRTSGSL